MINDYQRNIDNLKQNHLYRQTLKSEAVNEVVIKRGRKKFISFSCNDYLNLSAHPQVKKAAIAAIKKYGVGARSSRYITGNNKLYDQLEAAIAKAKNADDAIVFTSGYAAAIGVIPALIAKNDLVIADRLVHSCLLDGIKLSEAKLLRFKHNDLEHCQQLLESNRKNFKRCLIVTETVFSMDGDLSDISSLLDLCKKYDCLLLSDDAHGFGILKKNQTHATKYHIQFGTLSKAVGTLGGYVAADKIIIDYLRNFSKSLIYTTALPPAILAASLVSIKLLQKQNNKNLLGEIALQNAQYFCHLLKLKQPDSPIVIITIGDSAKVLQIAKNVAQKGFLISAIRPPTVEVNKARLRITFCAKHKKQQIEKLAKILTNELTKNAHQYQ